MADRFGVGRRYNVEQMERKEFRSFAHPPAGMLAVLGDRGLRGTFAHHGLVWQVTGLER